MQTQNRNNNNSKSYPHMPAHTRTYQRIPAHTRASHFVLSCCATHFKPYHIRAAISSPHYIDRATHFTISHLLYQQAKYTTYNKTSALMSTPRKKLGLATLVFLHYGWGWIEGHSFFLSLWQSKKKKKSINHNNSLSIVVMAALPSSRFLARVIDFTMFHVSSPAPSHPALYHARAIHSVPSPRHYPRATCRAIKKKKSYIYISSTYGLRQCVTD